MRKSNDLFLCATNKAVYRNNAAIRKTNCRPQRQLALTALVSLIYRELHMKQIRNILLRFITVLSQIPHAPIQRTYFPSLEAVPPLTARAKGGGVLSDTAYFNSMMASSQMGAGS